MLKNIFRGVILGLIFILALTAKISWPANNAANAITDPPLIINEVACKEQADVIELKVLTENSFGGMQILEGGTIIATIPTTWNLQPGDFILLHQNGSGFETDKADNNPLAFEIFGAGSLVGTDNVLQLKNPSNQSVIDAIIWSNANDNFTGSKTEANKLLTVGEWLSPAIFSSSFDAGAWTDSDDIKEGWSLQRTPNASDTNTPADWEIMPLTLGEENIPNTPPLVSITGPTHANFRDQVCFDGRASSDPEGETLSFSWNINEEFFSSADHFCTSFGTSGEQEITLEIEDERGQRANAATSIYINQPPAAFIKTLVKKGLALELSATDSTDEDGEIINYAWEFGDGEQGKGETVAHHYAKAGEYKVLLTITDDLGGRNTAQTNLKLDAPIPTCERLVLSEFLPNPSGDEKQNEFIEISNLSEDRCDASAFAIEDAGGTTMNFVSLEESARIFDPYEITAIYRSQSGIALNNNQEALSLLDAQGKIISLAGFETSAPEDLSYALIDNNWHWTTSITPGQANVLTSLNHPPIAKAGSNIKAKTEDEIVFDGSGSHDPDGDALTYFWDFGDGTTAEEQIPVHSYANSGAYTASLTVQDPGQEIATDEVLVKISAAETDADSPDNKKNDNNNSPNSALPLSAIAEAKKLDKNAPVKVRGIVTVPSDLLGDKTFYLQDDTAGILVASGQTGFQAAAGEEIILEGKISSQNKEKKINIKDAATAEKIGSQSVPPALAIATGEIGEQHEGRLVKISGAVVKNTSAGFYLNDGSGDATISIKKSAAIQKPDLKKDEAWEVTGVVSRNSDQFKLLPRYDSDFAPSQATVKGETSTSQQDLNAPTTGASTKTILLIGVALIAATILGQFLWGKYKQNQTKAKK